ncbi:MAG TPA: hypothetical protein VM935_05905, partial [Chitinophagaceae bacterium]|nr:hypothetical protein [Chitinophagaceae bacterium]
MQTEEKKPSHEKKNYVRKAARILLKVILFLLLFVVVLFLLILTPPVQRFATSKVENYLQKKLKTEVEIGSIGFTLSGKVHLKNIYVEDQSRDTLIAGGNIKATVSLGKLFSNEIEVKNVSLENITAKIKRTLPDTVFNFQFITDAFVTEKTTVPDTAQTAPLKLAINKLDVTNSNFVYKDVVTGNDMLLRVGNFSTRIDSLNLETSHFVIPSVDLSDVTLRFNQTTPLVAAADPIATDMAAAAEPITMKLDFGKINLNRINLLYSNDVSDLYSQVNIGQLSTEGKNLDLQNQVVHLKNLALNNTTAIIRSGNPQVVKVATKEVQQEVKAQTTQKNWDVRVDDIEINNNKIQYDDETKPRQKYGMDFAHLNADSLTLHIQNLVMSTDSMGASITKGYVREKNGFNLQELKADILYSSTQTSVKDFYFKTPGTELKRDFLLSYASYKALSDSFQNSVMDINIDESRVQVKDILHFAPQLRSQPAFSNPNEVWYLNAQVSGTMDRLKIAALQFNGLGNTSIDAYGTLASLTNPANAGANLTIRKFHTSQSDIALFTGARLSTAQINVPETFDIRGTIAGNAGSMKTNLAVNTSAGDINLNGQFTNLTNPKTATYNANIRTNGLRLGSILRNPQLGGLSAAFTVSGRGFTPDAMNTDFRGNIYNVGFNNYNYRNIALNGSMDGSSFKVNVDAKDPNASFNLKTSGILAANASFMVSGFIDSVKTLPLKLTTQPLVFRGRIEADIPSANPDNLLADVLISEALFVSGTNRMPIDSLRLVSGRSDTGQFIRLSSGFINAQLAGTYRLTDLGTIIQNNIQPYFPVSTYTATTISQPYDLSFNADLIYHPVLASFVPGLKSAKPIHAEGRLATGQGMQALVTAPSVVFGTNEINDLKININTADSGMIVNGTVAHLKSGSSFDLFNTRLNATILNNNINFNFRVGDQSDKDKYVLSGLVTQPGQGNINISLLPGNLLLNYEQWTISPGNSISIQKEQLFANNFILQKGPQQLSLNGGGANPLDLSFKEFKLATITGFVKSDSLLVDGTMNGTVSFKNIMQQPVFTSNLSINDLSFKQDTVGNINMQVSSSGNSYIADVNVTGRGNDVRLTGSFAPQGASDIALDLELAVNRLELNSFEGAMAAFVKSATGSVNGKVSINGTASKPQIQGALNFDSAAISTNLLGGPLFINDEKITVTENGFVFDNFTIRDSASNTLNVNGNVVSSNFINYAFQLDVDAKNFRALNTTIKDNKIFYGQLFINSNLH